MSIFFKSFFILYNFLWKFAILLLPFNKRLKDGFKERLIPEDWLHQKLLTQKNSYLLFDKDRYCYCLAYQNTPNQIDDFTEINPQDIKDFQVKEIDLWLQVASGGEAYLAIDFLKALPKKQKNYKILITTWTRQGMDVLERECAKVYLDWQNEIDKSALPIILIRFACFDADIIVKKAFNQAKPKLCVMFETELWPNFMLECKNRNIPLYVINARMTKTSYELYNVIDFVLKQISPKLIMATTKDDMDRFSKIFPSSQVSFMPNMKFDRAITLTMQTKDNSIKNIPKARTNLKPTDEIVQHNEQLLKPEFGATSLASLNFNKKRKFSIKKSRPFFSPQKTVSKDSEVLNSKIYLDFLPDFFSKANSVILFASIRKKEENLLSALLWKVFASKQKSLFIVAPKHMERVEHWFARFYDLGMRPILASEYFKAQNYELGNVKPFDVHQCIVWDIYGDLTRLYSEADFAFVGGSFKNLGGQNFLEALAGGICPHVGPDLDNFLWAIGNDNPPNLIEKKFLIKHNSKRKLKNFLLDFKEIRKNKIAREEIQKDFLEWLMKYKGTSKLAVEKILEDRALSN